MGATHMVEFDKSMVPFVHSGMSTHLWRDEGLVLSLLFAGGRTKFTDIVPADLRETMKNGRISTAHHQAFYVMCVSSLYWRRSRKSA